MSGEMFAPERRERMPPTPDNTVPWSKRPTFFLVPCLDFGVSTASVAAGAGACSEYESCSGVAKELAAKLASRCKQAGGCRRKVPPLETILDSPAEVGSGVRAVACS